jgi:O-antigen/teichoic acid export membrane protein
MPGEVLRIYGPGFVTGASSLRILIVGMIVPVMVGTVGFILIMAGRTGWDLVVYIAGFAIDIAVALTLARPEVLGMRGAAIAQAITLTFSAVARLLLVSRFLRIWPFDRAYLRLIVPTLVGAGVMMIVHLVLPEARWLVNLLASAALGTCAYVVVLFAVGLTPKERASALGMGRKVFSRSGSRPTEAGR